MPVMKPLHLVLILLTVVLLKASVWFLPLQRDAVGYAYIGKEIAHGAVAYRDVWDHKTPGVYALDAAVYSLFPKEYVPALLGASVFAAVLASLLLFMLLKKYFSDNVSFVATLAFAVFSNVYILTVGDNLVEGYMLPVLIGLYIVFTRAIQKKNSLLYITTGLLLAVLFVFKHIGILPVLGLGIYLFIKKRWSAWKEMFFIGIGVVVGIVPVVVYFWYHNALFEAFDAIVAYNMFYSKQGYDLRSLSQGVFYTLQVVMATLLFVSLAVVGFFRKKNQTDVLFILLFISSFLGVAMGGKFAFTRHYFLLLYPSLAYFVAKAIEAFYEKLKRDAYLKMSAAVLGIAILLPSLIVQGQAVLAGFYFRGMLPLTTREAPYILGIQNYNFVEEEKTYVRIASYLEQRVPVGDTILDWGAEPEVYLFTDTRAPTRYFYNFPLNGTFVAKDVTRETRRGVFMKELEQNPPLYIIANDKETKHQPSFQELDFPAFKEFVARNYDIETRIENFIVWKKKILVGNYYETTLSTMYVSPFLL